MADGRSRGGGNSGRFNGGQSKNDEEEDELQEESDETAIQLDIGLGGSNQTRNQLGSSNENIARREDNPFSFKHFLSRGSSVGGARPKVYPTSTPPPSPSPSRLISNSEMTSGLPDFVQDHLVIEQCYLNSTTPPQLAVDLENIPPPGSPERDFLPGGAGGADLPFDLTRPPGHHRSARPPLDLPDEGGGGGVAAGGGPDQVAAGLPDFLSDGPIRSERGGDLPPSPSLPPQPQQRPSSPEHHRLQIENERLRRALENIRRQLSDQITRSETLEAELCLLRSRDQSDTAALEKVVEQVEDNLKRATKRAVTAESQVSKLKEEVRTLTCELNAARSSRCREGGGAAASSSAHQTDNERLASQLRNAANNAELSLRHLLLGVDNLRQLASSLESQPGGGGGGARLRTAPSSSDDDSQEGNEPGPAL